MTHEEITKQFKQAKDSHDMLSISESIAKCGEKITLNASKFMQAKDSRELFFLARTFGRLLDV